MTASIRSLPTGTNYTAYVLAVLAAVLLIRLLSLYFNTSGLFFDEAQYWYWAQEPAFGYFSKPPLLAWIIAGTTAVCGNDGTFCIRMAAPVLHIFTALVIFLTARELFDAKTGFWASIVYALMPGVSLSSTIISTDVPLLLFWAVSLYGFVRLLESPNLKWILVTGISIGLGLNSKYAMIYFIACGFLYLFFGVGGTRKKSTAAFAAASALGLMMLIPNLVWNLQHSFVTVTHTGENIGWQGFSLNLAGALEFLGAQFGVFGPIAFGILVATLVRMRNPQVNEKHHLLMFFTLPVILLILFQAVMSKAYANWAATAYIAATILVADFMVNRIHGIWMKIGNGLNLLVFFGLSIAVCFAGTGQLVLPNGKQAFARTQGGPEIAEAIVRYLETENYEAILFVDRRLASLMNYHLRDRAEPMYSWVPDTGPRDHFQLAAPYQAAGIAPVLLVTGGNKSEVVIGQFETVQSLGEEAIDTGEINLLVFMRLDGFQKDRLEPESG